MPRPTPSHSKRTKPIPRDPAPRTPSPRDPARRSPISRDPAFDDVDPRWLLKAGSIAVLVALFCGYLTFCWLFYQGQWQLVLHPTRTAASQPPAPGAELVHFAPDESAVPQLTGWWIPAATQSDVPTGRYAHTTLLFLPGADGSLADSSNLLATLHTLGINIFAFDYRGYGQSAATRPSQKNMIEDTENALRYLHNSRAIPGRQIVPYGIGVGASLAARLVAVHPEIPVLILESGQTPPQTDLLNSVLHDSRARFLPVRLLFHEGFPLAAPLSTLRTPKLLLSAATAPAAFQSAAEPRTTVEFNALPGTLYNQPSLTQALLRFMDQYLPPTTIPPLLSAPASTPH